MSIFQVTQVTNLADSGEGRLRKAIALVNNQAGANEIIFAPKRDLF
ncbi:MAG: hypothetical protein QNJ72_42730 [Pleurocapsa sp. MO_226.B13]|nr:hypothetical protein [Pleurocapsa sp. MO_226.B13]